MFWMRGISLQCLGTFECAVEHHVAVRRVESSVDIHFDIYQSRHLSHQLLKTFLYAFFHFCFLLLREFWIQSPKNNMFYHEKKINIEIIKN